MSDSAFRFSVSSLPIGAFRLMPRGGIGDMNHLLYIFSNAPDVIKPLKVLSTNCLKAGSSLRIMQA